MLMRKTLFGFLLCAALLAAIAPATASTINVTNDSQVTLGTNDSLLFYISATDPCYPSEIEAILGGLPLAGPVASIPGTSGVYIPGILFTGAIESQNGSYSMPLTDPDATRLGLPDGDMLLTPGSRSGGAYSGSIDLLSAAATLSPAEADALFSSGEVVIDVHNTGAAITFGYPGTSIAGDFSASLIGQGGSQSVGARVVQVECVRTTAPEPGTIGLLIIGLTIICTRLGHARARQSQMEKVRVPAPADVQRLP
jgi:hypothetical protein